MVCGALCVKHIHQEHGKKISLRKAKEVCGTGRHGTRHVDMMDGLVKLGYKNVRCKERIKWGELKRLVDSGADVVVDWMSDLPAGNRPSPTDGHYSVAKKVTNTYIKIYDPDVDQIIELPRKYWESRWYDYEIDHAGKRTDYAQSAIIARYKP
jgi:ABC-type bacteriocin/lantibiotic exporter with double-glycine peptidase domain